MQFFSKFWRKEHANNYSFLLLFRGVLMFVIWGVDDKTVNVSIIDLKFQGPPKHKI